MTSLSCVNAHATIWYVHSDSTLDSIQSALNFCMANDTVLVGPGIYYENIVWPNTQGIDLISEWGPDTTVIDGGDVGSVITLTIDVDTTTIISGFMVRNGYSYNGGGILCDGASPIISANTIISNRATGAGGGVSCQSSAPVIIHNEIIYNYAYNGGGICCFNSTPVIRGNTICFDSVGIYSSFVQAGGGIYCDTNTMAVIDSNDISWNISYCNGMGIGIMLHNSGAVISNNTISNNYSLSGGWDGAGISCMFCPYQLAIVDNLISGNHTARLGGGVCLRWNCDSVFLSGNTITSNTAMTGGGIYLGEYCSAVMEDCFISGNNAEGGGIVCSWWCSLIVDGCTISDNEWCGLQCTIDGGGGVSAVSINHCNIHGNAGYGVVNEDFTVIADAEYNWWGDSTGPYHPTNNPGGLGDAVSDYVDFEPWLWWPVGVEEQPIIKPMGISENLTATIFRGPLQLPESKKCKVFDITGRVVEPDKIQPGIYFIEVDGMVTQKVVKIR